MCHENVHFGFCFEFDRLFWLYFDVYRFLILMAHGCNGLCVWMPRLLDECRCCFV